MLRLNLNPLSKMLKKQGNSNTTNVKVKRNHSAYISLNSGNSNTTNVKVKPDDTIRVLFNKIEFKYNQC